MPHRTISERKLTTAALKKLPTSVRIEAAVAISKSKSATLFIEPYGPSSAWMNYWLLLSALHMAIPTESSYI